MSTLAHYFEREGIPTAVISLIPIHTEKLKSPRGLAVPFELGRPYGAAHNPDLQKSVLKAQLTLFERPSGPVLEEFDVDDPNAGGVADWACSIELPPRFEDADDLAGLRAAFLAEIEAVKPSYDRAVKRRGRTTVGVSGMGIEMAANLIADFCSDPSITSPNPEFPLAMAIKLATEDVKAYYQEAACCDGAGASSKQIADWLWGETTASKMIAKLKATCEASDNEMIKGTAFGLAPMGRT